VRASSGKPCLAKEEIKEDQETKSGWEISLNSLRERWREPEVP